MPKARLFNGTSHDGSVLSCTVSYDSCEGVEHLKCTEGNWIFNFYSSSSGTVISEDCFENKKEINSVQKWSWLPEKAYGVHQKALPLSILWGLLDSIYLTGSHLHSRPWGGSWKGNCPDMLAISKMMGSNNEKRMSILAHFFPWPAFLCSG